MIEIRQGKAEDLCRELDDRPINCIITDPPYGVKFQSHMARTAAGKRWEKTIASDESIDGAIALFDTVMDELVARTAENAEMYVFTRWDIVGQWMEAIPAPFKYKMMLVWDKCNPGMGDIDANWGCGHELILYAKKGRRDVPYRRSSIISVPKVHPRSVIHPMEKPVPLIEKLLEMSTDPGDLVVDPFAGSGSTLVAAQRLGRDALGFELDPEYVERTKFRLGQGVLW